MESAGKPETRTCPAVPKLVSRRTGSLVTAQFTGAQNKRVQSSDTSLQAFLSAADLSESQSQESQESQTPILHFAQERPPEVAAFAPGDLSGDLPGHQVFSTFVVWRRSNSSLASLCPLGWGRYGPHGHGKCHGTLPAPGVQESTATCSGPWCTKQ